MKVGLVTINNSNYGNRLQNYAIQEVLRKYNVDTVTIRNISLMNKKKNNIEYILRNVKHLFKKNDFLDKKEREQYFVEFNKYIDFSKKTFNWFNLNWLNEFDYFITGSDQVWNPKFRLSKFDLLTFTSPEKRISFSASIAIDSIPDEYKELFKKEVREYKAISVREEKGKEIVEELTKRRDVELLVDPTMLLSSDEWDKVAKKPKQLKSEKYILNYFLGELSEKRKKEIQRIADENNCKIINILDENDPFYETGPSEFLYLEKNAFLVCTDSFHSSVFSILYNRPFIVFEREDEQHINMNSRLKTLITKLQLKDREFNESYITDENLNHDYTDAYKILEIERSKSFNFLKNALKIEQM